MGVGSREAFGVRQLAAALCFRANNVSVPISAPYLGPHPNNEPVTLSDSLPNVALRRPP
ncbi:MAG: hypothetical protein GX456_15300 [Verrucomicrobia bacterium]|nr:hypothetical protein [Verrucomicrobiota bacterium]